MSVDQVQDYGPPLVAIVFGIGFSVLFLALAMFIGPQASRPRSLRSECGSGAIGSPRVRFSGEVLPGSQSVSHLRHRVGVSVPVGGAVP